MALVGGLPRHFALGPAGAIEFGEIRVALDVGLDLGEVDAVGDRKRLPEEGGPSDDANLVRVAGPLLDDEGTMIGSLFIMEAESRNEVQAFADNDPYTAAGVFESVEIKGFTVARGAVG